MCMNTTFPSSPRRWLDGWSAPADLKADPELLAFYAAFLAFRLFLGPFLSRILVPPGRRAAAALSAALRAMDFSKDYQSASAPPESPVFDKRSWVGADEESSAPLVAAVEASEQWTFAGARYEGDPQLKRQLLFVARVYGSLSAQLATTAAVCLMFMKVGAMRTFAVANPLTMTITPAVLVFALLFGMFTYRHRYPLNMAILGGFTLSNAVLIGTLCAVYETVGMGDLVVEALLATLGSFVVLTIFASQTKVDFTPIASALSAALCLMIFYSFAAFVFGFTAGIWYSIIGAVVMCLFIIVDTQMILSQRFADDEWIIASCELYLDVINLFLHLLRILTELSRR